MSSTQKPKRVSGGRITCTVTCEPERVRSAEERAVKRMAASLKIPGFRPGTAPPDLVRSKLDPDRLFEETVRLLLPETFSALLQEYGIKPIIQPKVEVKSRAPLTIDITFIERPEARVKGAAKIRIEKKPIVVDAKDVDRMIAYFRRERKSLSSVERAAQMGDEVTVDFAGKDGSGTAIEGTTAKGYRVELGSHALIPGFEEALAGMQPGETKSFTVTFPEKYHAENLRGKPVTFTATVQKVFATTLPPVDDAFAKHFGAPSVPDLRRRIEEQMRKQEEQIEHVRRERLLLEEIRNATTVEIAPELVEEEEKLLLEELASELERQGRTVAQYFQESQKSPVEMREELTENAKKRITLRLGLQQLVEATEKRLSDEDMRSITAAALAQVPQEERPTLERDFREKGERYERLKWQKEVEGLIEDMLAR